MGEGTPKQGKRAMTLKESAEQIMNSRDSLPRHVKVVAEWNRAILDARRGPPTTSDDRDR